MSHISQSENHSEWTVVFVQQWYNYDQIVPAVLPGALWDWRRLKSSKWL